MPQYHHLMESGLYEALLSRRLIVPHKEVELDGFDEGIVIQPKRIPFISYPYEWCFDQYRDAALATMDIQNAVMEYGMVLKDASAYNIQFLNGHTVLIDTLSFDFYSEGSPWGAYGQFCRHFFAPLLLMSEIDERMGRIMQSFIDGIPLDLAASLLKGRGGFAAQKHIVLHSKAVNAHNDDGKKGAVKQTVMSKKALTAFCESIRSDTAKLRRIDSASEWGNYYSNTNYTDSGSRDKAEIVREMLGKVAPLKHVWDLGANDGRFSRISVEMGVHAVAFDLDYRAVEQNWKHVKETHEKMLPLVLDLSAPSPAIGFANEERKTISERQKPDCIMMLAVIHHMAISNNVPFEKIAAWVVKMTDNLIIEFVPKDDSQVQVLLATREDIFSDYDEAHFEQAFGHWFDLEIKKPVIESKRSVYLWHRKKIFEDGQKE